MSGFSFKKSELPEQSQGDFKPIEAGQYQVQFQDLQEKQTQAGGVQWSAMLKIVGGDKFVGRQFWTNWNVENANEQAQQIGRREVAQIADLIGVGDDISIQSLKTNKIFTVVVEPREYMGKTQYNTKNWKLAEEKTAQKNFVTKATTPATETKPAAKKQPWAKA